MQTFTKSTTFEELFELIEDWSTPMSNFYNGIEDKKERLNKILQRSLPKKRLEILYTQLNKLNNEVLRLSLPFIRSEGEESHYLEDQEDWEEFKHIVYSFYNRGADPIIGDFKELIKRDMRHTFEYLHYTLEYDIEKDLKYGDSLAIIANKILVQTLNNVNDQTIGKIEGKKHLEELLYRDENTPQEITTTNPMLTWKAKPAHLAFIIDLLIEKGYLEATPYAERTAKILLEFIKIDGYRPSVESLGKLLHKDNFPISDSTVIDRFKRIPERKELK